jgi:hypothetical protein
MLQRSALAQVCVLEALLAAGLALESDQRLGVLRVQE